MLEIFQAQIARGGPVTVTHPEVQRYFMTVQEAAALILQAAAMAKGGEIFILKMGTPVKILEMAKNLILLSGLEPGKDVERRVTGLKQGEKLNEELADDPADCGDSEHPSIMVLRADQGAIEGLDGRILEFEVLNRSAKPDAVVRRIRELAPTFTPAAAHGQPGLPDLSEPASA